MKKPSFPVAHCSRLILSPGYLKPHTSRLFPIPLLEIQSIHILFFNLTGICSLCNVISYISDGLCSNARTNCVTLQIIKSLAAEPQVSTPLTQVVTSGDTKQGTSTSSQHIIYIYIRNFYLSGI
jgi:hypothetical protein